MINLNDFKRNAYSQHGEDGILSRLFEELGVTAGTFCEFGAWDGIHLSNTYALFKRGWSGVYIEGDKKRFADLERNITGDRVDLICTYVRLSGEDKIDSLLDRSSIIQQSGHLDLLSIDIDSDDLAVFASLETHRASVVVIEYNSTIPLDVEYINPPGENKGNSVRSILLCAQKKQYELVAVTATNLVLVAKEILPKTIKTFGLESIDVIPKLRFFFGFDGTLLCSKSFDGLTEVKGGEFVSIPWKKGALFPQPVPKMFRRYAQGLAMHTLLQAYSVASAIVTRPFACTYEAWRRFLSSDNAKSDSKIVHGADKA